MFVCKLLKDGICVEWVQVNYLFLEKGQGIKIGFVFLMLTVLAWSISRVVSLILNR